MLDVQPGASNMISDMLLEGACFWGVMLSYGSKSPRFCSSAVCGQVIQEVTGGLEGWSSKNRWEDLGIVQQLRDNPQYKWVYP